MQETKEPKTDLLLQFVALMLHDLETPFAVTKQFLRRVQSGQFDADNPRHKKLVNSTLNAVNRGERILEDLLEQARSGSMEIPVYPEEANVHQVFQECTDIVASIAEDKNVRIVVTDVNTLPESLSFDPRVVSRILDNLLVNAIRHAQRDSVIDMRCEKEDNTMRVAIINSPEEETDIDMTKIFDPEYQILMRQQRRMRGTGLGLSYCRMATEAHGGSIGAFINDDGKHCFWFDIPNVVKET